MNTSKILKPIYIWNAFETCILKNTFMEVVRVYLCLKYTECRISNMMVLKEKKPTTQQQTCAHVKFLFSKITAI